MASTNIQIPSELFALAESSRFEGEADVPLLVAGPDDYRFSEPLSWAVDITNTGAAFLVSGTVTGHAVCACARCLEDVEHDFEGQVEGYYLIDAASREDGDDEDELGDDEFDILPADHVIDIMPLLQAALIVDAPDQPLCKDDCKGLCPQCGANLNEGDCGCADLPDPTNPFAALAGLKFE